MKLVLLMYLEEDRGCVERLLTRHRVPVFTETNVEGHRPGRGPGWYGKAAPYASSMTMAVLPDERAAELLEAVRDCRGLEDARHPVHAYQMGIERSAATGPREANGES